MGVYHVSDSMPIKYHAGTYGLEFIDSAFDLIFRHIDERTHFILDKNIATIYQSNLESLIKFPSCLFISANEESKSLNRISSYVESFVQNGIRRDHTIIAIGGGVIQDIASFLSSTLLRGLDWKFFPTTLLAQADSCIGSKSSINVGNLKNILGTYCPPKNIYIDLNFLKSLKESDFRSGIGEMLKIHAIAGPDKFQKIKIAYESLFNDEYVLKFFIRNSLLLKKEIIEADEYDKNERLVMNYGHSFGHAIEAATTFKVPHGIAVTLGMDFANYISMKTGRSTIEHYDSMHSLLMKNSEGFNNLKIEYDDFIRALSKDKKNIGNQLRLVLPNINGIPEVCIADIDENFISISKSYLSKI